MSIDIENLAKEYARDKTYKETSRYGFIAGFKAAQQLSGYTEEDLRAVANHFMERGTWFMQQGSTRKESFEEHISKFLSYDKTKSQQLSRCDWVKASERLPEKEGVYFVKWEGGNNGVIFFNGKRFETYIGKEKYIDKWLDESPPIESELLTEDEIIKKNVALFHRLRAEVNSAQIISAEQTVINSLKQKGLVKDEPIESERESIAELKFAYETVKNERDYIEVDWRKLESLAKEQAEEIQRLKELLKNEMDNKWDTVSKAEFNRKWQQFCKTNNIV